VKAIRISAIGGKLAQFDIAAPVPGAGEVRVAVKAAGICHSDAHYRAGVGKVAHLPITPGHEVAGIIDAVGAGVNAARVGERVCLHYLVSCGSCSFCRRGIAQFCPEVAMIGKDRDGGYAEFICVPSGNAIALPDAIPFAQAAVMMCAYATSLHALRKARFAAGESVAVFGAGGLGMAAIGIAAALGASRIIAVDNNPAKLKFARDARALCVDAADAGVVRAIHAATDGRGVDVALELVGLPVTTEQAVQSLAVLGRVAVVGLANADSSINMYRHVIGKEREIVGVSDHLPEDILELIAMVADGRLDIESSITDTVPLDEAAINPVFDAMDDNSSSAIRTVITA